MATAAALPPGPDTLLPIRNLLRLLNDPLPFLASLADEFGDAVRLHVGPREVYLFNHPDFLRDVLVTHERSFMKGAVLQQSKRLLGEGLLTSEGEAHLRQRRLLQPAFHRQRLAEYGRAMVRRTDSLAAGWGDGQVVDVAEEMRRLTLAIVGETLFGASVEEEAGLIGEALDSFLELSTSLLLPFASLLEWLPLPQARRMRAARSHLDAVVSRLIAERRRGPERNDVLSLLLAARDEDGGGPALTDTQVRDEVMTLLLAGHETTAHALAWAFMLLGRRADVEARLQAELDVVLDGRVPTADDFKHLTYTRQVFSEALRLYPPAWAIGRRCLEPVEIGGWTVPRDAIAVVSPYLIQRDHRWFDMPQRFDPSRFASDKTPPRYVFSPFGAGSRMCIGEGFAWMEGVLVLATIAQRWHVRLLEGQNLVPQARITLRPAHGVKVKLQARRR